jgi:hypothetical protein
MLGMQAGLVPLHDQDVMGFLVFDQELRVAVLGVHRVCGDHAPGQVQGIWQRGELGDLIGLAVHPSLGQHGTSLLIEGSQQVHSLPVAAGMPGAPHCLAVHGHRPPLAVALPVASSPRLPGEPGPHRGVQRSRVHGFQDPAEGGFIRRPGAPGQRIPAYSQRDQDLWWRVRDPLTDRGERPCLGQHRRHGSQ